MPGKSILDSIIDEAKKEVHPEPKLRLKSKPKSQKKEPEPEPEVKLEPNEDSNQDVVTYTAATDGDVSEIVSKPFNMDKDQLFREFLTNVDISGMNITKDEKEQVNNELELIQKSYLGIIKRCPGELCNHNDICPFTRINRYPTKQPCPLEICIAKHSATEYFKLLQAELRSNNFNAIEINTVYSLVDIEVDEFRTRNFLTQGGTITKFAAFAIKRTGEVIYNKTENPVYNIIEKLSRRKHRLLQRLLLTPESRARYHVDLGRGRKDKTREILMRAEKKMQQILKGDSGGKSTESSE